MAAGSTLIWLVLPLIVGALVGGLIVLAAGRARPRRRASDVPQCGACGYNLTGAPANRCPECGALFIEAGVTFLDPQRGSRLRRRRLLLGLTAFVIFAGAIGFFVALRQVAVQRALAARQAALQAQAAALARAQAAQRAATPATAPAAGNE
jgi:predicted RNA-binding Zn-ribbon protein involved in translation (DUF1610 family)